MCKQLAKSQHQAIHKWKNEVNGSSPQDTPDGWGLVEDQGGARGG